MKYIICGFLLIFVFASNASANYLQIGSCEWLEKNLFGGNYKDIIEFFAATNDNDEYITAKFEAEARSCKGKTETYAFSPDEAAFLESSIKNVFLPQLETNLELRRREMKTTRESEEAAAIEADVKNKKQNAPKYCSNLLSLYDSIGSMKRLPYSLDIFYKSSVRHYEKLMEQPISGMNEKALKDLSDKVIACESSLYADFSGANERFSYLMQMAVKQEELRKAERAAMDALSPGCKEAMGYLSVLQGNKPENERLLNQLTLALQANDRAKICETINLFEARLNEVVGRLDRCEQEMPALTDAVSVIKAQMHQVRFGFQPAKEEAGCI